MVSEMGDLIFVKGVDQAGIDEGDGDSQSHHNDVLGHSFGEGVPLRHPQRYVGRGKIHLWNIDTININRFIPRTKTPSI